MSLGMRGATIAPRDMTGIEIGTKAKIGIETGISMTTETEGIHGEIGRIWNEIRLIFGTTT
jgi:hypothetical protein